MQTGKRAIAVTFIFVLLHIALPALFSYDTASAAYVGLSVKMNGSETNDEFGCGVLNIAAENADQATLLFVVCEKNGVINAIKRGAYNENSQYCEAELIIDDTDKFSVIRIYRWNSSAMTPLGKSIALYPGDNTSAGQRVYCAEDFEDLTTDKHISTIVNSNTEILDKGCLTVAADGSTDYSFDVALKNTTGKIILQADISASDDNIPNDIRLFHLIGISAAGKEEKHGYGRISGNRVWGKMITQTPTRFAIAVDLEKNTYDIFIDGELYRKDIDLGYDYSLLKKWKIWIPSGSTGKLVIDNVLVYDGEKPYTPEYKSSVEFSVFNDSDALSVLYGKRAISPWANSVFYDGAKRKTDMPCRIIGDEALISKLSFEKLFNIGTEFDGDVISIGENAEMYIGSTELIIGGKAFAMSAAPQLIDGTLYLPARSYGISALGTERFIDDLHGLFIVNENALNISDEKLKEANLYMFFERRSKTALNRLINENTGGNMKCHPRLMLNAQDVEALKYAVAHDSVKKQWFDRVKAKADDYMTKEVLPYKITNGRLLDTANEALERTSALAFTYLITGDRKYGDRAIAEVEAVCNYSDWHPEHFLDTATLAQAAAIGYDWAYDCMTVQQTESLAQKAFALALEPARKQYFGEKKYGFNWHKTETNWGIVANGGIANLALAICEYETEKSLAAAAEALRSMEYAIYRIAPDGAWHEGASYWRYSSKALALVLSGFEGATGILHEAVNFKGMDGYAGFSDYLLGPDYQAYNFGDSSGGAITSYIQSYIAAATDNDAMMNSRLSMLKITKGGSVFDIIWCGTASENENMPGVDTYYRETEFISMRERRNKDKNDNTALWLAAHGGDSTASHSHLDAGSFVFNLGGVRWAVDLGKEDYSYAENDPSINTELGKFYYYRRKGEGHNLVVINPDKDAETDKNAFAEFTAPKEGALGAFSVIELSKRYEKNANSYTRGFLLGDNRRSLTVRDEISLKHDGSELYWFMHTKGKITVLNKNTALIRQNNKTLKVEFLTNAESFALNAMDAKRLDGDGNIPETQNTGIQKLAMHITGASGNINITAKMSMADESISEISDIDTAAWGK